MPLHFDRQPIASIDESYPLYGAAEFESPTRSTIPLLSWLKHEPAAVKDLFGKLRVPAERTEHLEYTVNPPQGIGAPSHTDLMVLAAGTSVAVECKWTEPAGKTVQQWYPTVNEVNGPAVLDGWLQLLERVALQPLGRDHFHQAIYQTIHRAASACHAGDSPQLVYLLFRPSFDIGTANPRVIRDELAHFWRLLGRPDTFPIYLVQIEMTFTETFRRIVGLPRGCQQTATAVEAALRLPEKLFFFKEPLIERVDADS